ncbi:hypothetical protein [Runella salmonicolor]|uniref:Lipoprotein n=1 Tax=Runella salmonicolor TaxID=2950278 RepID=A0ABT1FXF8_9BACT|nr:hypothetical protein [Runella salmonicolor]MCP1386434.1 hypothetical protein [Runella salmonicolor]
MKTLNLKSVFCLFVCIFMLSCKTNLSDDQINPKQGYKNARAGLEEKEYLKKSFAISLAKSLKESKMFREILKSEALKQFDEDYDVLYNFIKNKTLENNVKVKDLILKNMDNRAKIKDIERLLPTLTIFVPSLPMESFSASKWNVETQIPKVAIRSFTSNDIPVIDSELNESVIPAKYIPGFPVVVVKENIRLISKNHIDYNRTNTNRILKDSDGGEYKFIDNCFDKEFKKNKRIALFGTLNSKIVDAYTIFQNTDNWHRDHIYYGLSLSSSSGPFNYDFEERITSFKFVNGNAYSVIADQTEDPQLLGSIDNTSQTAFWTSGSFVFKFKALINAKNGVGAEVSNFYYASPVDIFEIQYQAYQVGYVTFYAPINVVPKEVNPNISIFKWNLYEYSTSIKISVEEIDSQETQTTTFQNSATFAANFDASGTINKVGLKFGSSFQQSQNITSQIVTTLGSDILGDCIVNFADNVITGTGSIFGINYYNLQEYGSAYKITVEPIKVQ